MKTPDMDELNKVLLWASLFLVGYGLGKIVYAGLIALILRQVSR